MVMVMAQIYSIVGKHDRAIDELEYLLSIPSRASPAYIRADPFFDPLEGMPRFEAMLDRYEKQFGSTP